MANGNTALNLILILPTILLLTGYAQCNRFVIKNNCNHKVWVGILGQTEGDGKKWSTPEGGGFLLNPGGSRALNVELKWSGVIWGRTGCVSNGRANHLKCETGDCDTRLQCGGKGGDPPLTQAEFTMNGGRPEKKSDGIDFYDMSLVAGYNLRMRILPPKSGCREGNCLNDMTRACPAELQQKNSKGVVVGCRANGGTEAFVKYAKQECPKAYAYWNDDTKTIGCDPTPGTAPGTRTFNVNFCK